MEMDIGVLHFESRGNCAMNEAFQRIGDYFTQLRTMFDVNVCIKDYCGFVPINKELDAALQPFLNHENPYCMYVKQDRDKYLGCLSMIPKMRTKCLYSTKSYFGMCFGGLGEYVVPIRNGEFLLGSINLGFFPVGRQRSYHRIRAICNSSGQLKEETARQLFEEISTPSIEPVVLVPFMELIADYLAMTYANFQKTHNVPVLGRKHYNSSEDSIITHALKYIHQNYAAKISIDEISGFCHCSISYLSHVFKRRLNVNINTYINKVRTETAKDYLVQTDDSITDVSMNVGFSDPNYFSRVFTKLMGIPPTEYRRRFQDK